MTANAWIQVIFNFVVLTALVVPLGAYMAKVLEGETTWLSRILGPVVRLCYRVAGVDPSAEMGWKLLN